MKRWFLEYLPYDAHLTVAEAVGEEVLEGVVHGGEAAVTVRQGVPLLAPELVRESGTARSFGFEWGCHMDGTLEEGTSFGYTLAQELDYFFTATGTTADALAGLTVLDGGCGSGRLTRAVAELGSRHVIGTDINQAIFQVAPKAREQANLTYACVNLLDTGLKPESIDLVWSNGVIHHTPDPRRAFRELARLVKPGGRLYVWVYGTHFSPLVFTRDVLERFGLRHWSHGRVLFLSRLFAALLLPIPWLARLMTTLLPFLRRHAVLRNMADRWAGWKALTMIWFDVLSPQYRYTYDKATLSAWFREEGFQVIGAYDYQTGILGRKPQ